MNRPNFGYGVGSTLAVLALLLSGISISLADQVIITYVDGNSQSQTLVVDANSPEDELNLAAVLLNEYGVDISLDSGAGTGSIAQIAGAMADAAPNFAPDIAKHLAALSPEDTDAIVAAVNAVPGVSATTVGSAVEFGPPGIDLGPPTENPVPQLEDEVPPPPPPPPPPAPEPTPTPTPTPPPASPDSPN